MLDKISNKFQWSMRVILSRLGFMRKYKINNVEIMIDYTHRLPDYQKTHSFYDRFLPFLVKELPSRSCVIDIGANIGDTLAGMVGSNRELCYVCIEADDYFYAQLLRNIERIKCQIPSIVIHPVKSLVGLQITNATLQGKGGTKHAVEAHDTRGGGGAIRKSQTLESIIAEMKINKNSISLLKTDVDGFDWDVVTSAGAILDHNPLIYFECMYETNRQLLGYRNAFKNLIDRGYANFAFFDNFGQYILSIGDYSRIDDMLEYVNRQNNAAGTQAINYYDVLCFHEHSRDLVVRSISDLNARI